METPSRISTVAPPRVAIIGAGPIGLEAAILGCRSGFDVQVFEAGVPAENLRQWGHVRLFSPFGLNVSEWGRRAILDSGTAAALPDDDALLTGQEFVDRYLVPLSRHPDLAGRIHSQTRVLAVGRCHYGKGDLIGQPQRARDPFRLLLHDDAGEKTVESDYVLDCSGTYPRHNWLGAGGIPCPGEHVAHAVIRYTLPDILGIDRATYAGQTVLVIGDGYSAATTIVNLATLAEAAPATRVVWVTRKSADLPLSRIADDSLRERDRLAETANKRATSPSGVVEWRSGRHVQSIEPIAGSDSWRVTLEAPEKPVDQPETSRSTEPRRVTSNRVEQVIVDRIVANVGYRPERTLYEELQVHECYASQGPMKLAAKLLGETSADCLKQASHGVDTLRNPEPGFFILGSKSYGRSSRFLLRTGFEQIQAVIATLSAESFGQ